jgi:hypothetical protein
VEQPAEARRSEAPKPRSRFLPKRRRQAQAFAVTVCEGCYSRHAESIKVQRSAGPPVCRGQRGVLSRRLPLKCRDRFVGHVEPIGEGTNDESVEGRSDAGRLGFHPIQGRALELVYHRHSIRDHRGRANALTIQAHLAEGGVARHRAQKQRRTVGAFQDNADSTRLDDIRGARGIALTEQVLSTMRGTLMRLLPAVPPDSTPIEQWPRDSPTDRDHWKHWLVPVVWPALSDIVNELHPTSSDEAARVRSELAPVTIIAAQLYLGLLLIRKPLPTADMLTGLVLSSLRAMPLAYAPSYVEQFTKHAGPLKLAAVIAIDSIHKLIQALIAELTSHKR